MKVFRAQRGFTLIELTIAVTILATLLLVITVAFISLVKSQASVLSMKSTNQAVRSSFSAISEQARLASQAKVVSDPATGFDQICLYQSGIMKQYYVADSIGTGKRSIYESDKGSADSCSLIPITSPAAKATSSGDDDVAVFKAWVSAAGQPSTLTIRLGITTNRSQLDPTNAEKCQSDVAAYCSVSTMETSVALQGASGIGAPMTSPAVRPVVADPCATGGGGFALNEDQFRDGNRVMCYGVKYQAYKFMDYQSHFPPPLYGSPVVKPDPVYSVASPDGLAMIQYGANGGATYNFTYISSQSNPAKLLFRLRQDVDQYASPLEPVKVNVAVSNNSNGRTTSVTNMPIEASALNTSYVDFYVPIGSILLQPGNYLSFSITFINDSWTGGSSGTPGPNNDRNLYADYVSVLN